MSARGAVRHSLFVRAYALLSAREEAAGQDKDRRELLAGLEGRGVEVGGGNGLTSATTRRRSRWWWRSSPTAASSARRRRSSSSPIRSAGLAWGSPRATSRAGRS